MIINHNMSAIFSERNLKFNGIASDKDMEKLSSGLRINRAGDDASGLAVSEKMRSQIRGLRQAESNSQNGISFIQTAEGYLQESQDILQRMRELAVQASNGIYSNEDRMQIQVEVSQLVSEVNRIASHAQFNGMNMLTGRFARATGENSITASMWLHIGANMDQRVRVIIGTMTAQGLGIQGTSGTPNSATFISLSSPDHANAAIGVLDHALRIVNKQRADLGAYQKARLCHEGPVDRRGEPASRGIVDPRHRHGGRNGGVRQGPDPCSIFHRDARAGQHAAPVGSPALQVGKAVQGGTASARAPRRFFFARASAAKLFLTFRRLSLNTGSRHARFQDRSRFRQCVPDGRLPMPPRRRRRPRHSDGPRSL